MVLIRIELCLTSLWDILTPSIQDSLRVDTLVYEPYEYWMTLVVEDVAESGMGNISKSGYLERKMIRGIESYVVDGERRVVNLRTMHCFSYRW